MRSPVLASCLIAALAACGDRPEPDHRTPEPGTELSDSDHPTPEPGTGPRGPGRRVFEQRVDVVGRWSSTSVSGGAWIVFRDDGRYRYSGVAGESSGGGALGELPPWANPHLGSWTYVDGVLDLTADGKSGKILFPFEFDPGEGSLNLRVVGRAPSGVAWIVFWQDAKD